MSWCLQHSSISASVTKSDTTVWPISVPSAGYYRWHWAHEGRPGVDYAPCAVQHLSPPANFLLWPMECCVPNGLCQVPPSELPQAEVLFLFSPSLGHSFPHCLHSHFCVSFCPSFKAWACAPTPPGSQCMCLCGRPVLSTRERKARAYLTSTFREPFHLVQ